MITQVPVSVGELLDKMSILRIKLKNFVDETKLRNVHRELDALIEVANAAGLCHEALEADLDKINGELWVIEDDLRILESKKEFGENFVRLARSVYFTNDRRAAVKKELNHHFDSDLVEEKEYIDYGSPA
jgi:hypothetical protein